MIMKKYSLFIAHVVIILCAAFLLQCEGLEKAKNKANEHYYKSEIHKAFKSGRYVRDSKTNLCFFVVDAYQGISITCVPCDSLRFVRVYEK